MIEFPSLSSFLCPSFWGIFVLVLGLSFPPVVSTVKCSPYHVMWRDPSRKDNSLPQLLAPALLLEWGCKQQVIPGSIGIRYVLRSASSSFALMQLLAEVFPLPLALSTEVLQLFAAVPEHPIQLE